ncbi:hypothetical protein CQW23_10325 [Capsicum baccatum]|uniref:Uncharacterized protein n=1 Tax=Capsicum baccatum TaxID=33114 RepID=A0A2G2WZB1_CAPBA|nr:hypothetical protein CQW23_10325 [Capsicum baccatum]
MRIVLIPTFMELLENMKNLQELWLDRNRIRTVNLFGLKYIKKISLQSNRLTSMMGFQGCVSLEELNLSHRYYENGRLEDLWLNDNNIASLEGLAEAITGAREKLTTIYLERNPYIIRNLVLKVLQNFISVLVLDLN